MNFVPRKTSDGMSTSETYYKYIYGTTTPNIPLPNCTFYAFSRTMEIAITMANGDWANVQHYSNPYWWRNESTYGNAYQWWSQCENAAIWQKDENTPRLGAIACFYQTNSDGGHVAIVEGINSDGTVNLSWSEYGGQYFVYKENVTLVHGQRMKINGATYGFGKFRGYIYNPLCPQTAQVNYIIYRRYDKVKIIKYGNANSYGTGIRAYGIGWNRIIQKVWEGRPYPYQVGYKYGGTTGFYKADALKLIERGT